MSARNKLNECIGKPLSHAIIFDLHESIGTNHTSEYRIGWGSPPIRNPVTREIRYWPPNSGSRCITKLMDELLEWYNQADTVIEKAARMHWGLVKIHPFLNGNGRLARMLVLIVLRNNGYDNAACDLFEEYLINDRKLYEDSLDDGVKNYSNFRDISSDFIDYFREGEIFLALKQNKSHTLSC